MCIRDRFHTGDQGFMDEDGYLKITGRLKEIINRGGEKVAPVEVDEVLMEHPAVHQAVTFAVPHDKLGEDVAAAVVLRDGQSVNERALQDFANTKLAAFKVPRRLLILEAIPKGATGTLQRIGLAQALVNDPRVLFLDEPTSGLDPIAHLEIRDLILRLRDEGRTVFLSSHQLSDVEMVCDRVSIMNRGKVLKVGALKDLLAGQTTEVRAEKVSDAALAKVKEIAPDAFLVEDALSARVEPDQVNRLVDVVVQNGGHIVAVTPSQRTLEDIFIETIQQAGMPVADLSLEGSLSQ